MENLENPVVPAVNRALNILEFVAKAREPVSIKASRTKFWSCQIQRLFASLSNYPYGDIWKSLNPSLAAIIWGFSF